MDEGHRNVKWAPAVTLSVMRRKHEDRDESTDEVSLRGGCNIAPLQTVFLLFH